MRIVLVKLSFAINPSKVPRPMFIFFIYLFVPLRYLQFLRIVRSTSQPASRKRASERVQKMGPLPLGVRLAYHLTQGVDEGGKGEGGVGVLGVGWLRKL